MSFIYPSFLWALGALSIPIIIHLFHFRRFKKVYFTNVRFLKEVKEERASRSKLKHLLVLLSRLLALIFLILAFAQPFIPKGKENKVVQGAKSVSIYIDNSFSMGALSNDVSLFEQAKRKAGEIVNAFRPEDRFQLMTNDFEGKHQRLLNKDEFLAYLEEVNIGPNVQQLSEVTERQKQAFETEESAQDNIFIISDFQKNIVDFENDTSIQTYLVPLQSVEQKNVFIDSVWFESPVRMLNQSNTLLMRIQNTGESDVTDSRLELRINDEVKAINNFDVAARSQTVDTLNFTITQSGWHKAEMTITDYPISFDDSYYFTFEVADKIDVLSVNQGGNNRYLNGLFRNDLSIRFQSQSATKVDYEQLPTNQFIILDQLRAVSSGLASKLHEYVKAGGNLLVFPADDAELNTYNALLKTLGVNTYIKKRNENRQIDYINIQQEVFKDVFDKIPKNIDLPYANVSYDMTSYSNTGEEVILRFKGGGSAVSKYRVGEGKVYVAALSMSKETNLPAHAIFAPMLYKMSLAGSKSPELAYTIGNGQLIEVENKEKEKEQESPFKLKGKQGEFFPGQKKVGSKLLITLNNELKEAGVYELFMKENTPLSFFGFNFDRQESVLEYLSLVDLKERYQAPNIKFIEQTGTDISGEVGEYDKGRELWKWCLILALVFLAVETLLLRLWKD